MLKYYKYACSIRIFDDGLNFYTDCADAYCYLKNLKHFFYIDCFSVDSIDSSLKYSLIFKDTDEKNGIVDKISSNTFELIDSWNRICNTTHLRSVIYQIIEAARQENSRFLIHGSAVSIDKGSIVFIGDGGSGKTSIMLKMCLGFGAKMISNDKVVVGLYDNNLMVDRGSRYLNLRESSISIFNPTLYGLFEQSRQYENSNGWNNKKKFVPEELGIKFEENKTNLMAIVMIDVNESWTGPAVFYSLPDKDIKESWLDIAALSRFFTVLIRGVEQVPFINGNVLHQKFFMPLLDNGLASEKRMNFLDRIISERRVYILKARLNQCVDLVVNNLFDK